MNTREPELNTPRFPFEGENLLQTGVYAMVPSKSRWLSTAESLVTNENPDIGAAALHLLIRNDPVRQLKLLREKLASELFTQLTDEVNADEFTAQGLA